MEIDEWWYADPLPRDIAPQGLATERRFKALVFFCSFSYQSPEAGAPWQLDHPEGEADPADLFYQGATFPKGNCRIRSSLGHSPISSPLPRIFAGQRS